jgi:hypothetical protein
MSEDDRENVISDGDLLHVKDTVKTPEKLNHDHWKMACRLVSAKLKRVVASGGQDAGKTVFAAVQQVSSVLRTLLTQQLGSREIALFTDPNWPGGRVK